MAKKRPARKPARKSMRAKAPKARSRPVKAKAKPARSAKPTARRAAIVRTVPVSGPLVTIIEPVTDSDVGRTFTVQGTCDGPPGTAVIVTLMDGNTVVASVTVNTDDQGTWSAEFANIAPNNNFRITVQLVAGGPVVAEVTDIDVAEFSIVDPLTDSQISPQLSVSGSCFDLIATPALTIDVTYTVPSGTSISQPAETDPPLGTWIAYFPALPAGPGGSFTAAASNGTHSDPVSGLTISSTLATTITEPVDGQDFDDIEPPPPPFAPTAGATVHKARGTFRKAFKVKAYVTRKGKRVAAPIPVKDDGFVSGSTTIKKWSIELHKLFRQKAPPGRYHFHLVAVNPSATPPVRHHRSAGKFRVVN